MASSAHKQPEYPPNLYGATVAPPPTPSTQPNHHLASSAATADALSCLLHRLPPALSLPTRRSPSTPSLPAISLSEPKLTDLILSSASQLGFFQLCNHDIPSQLAASAETESLSLFKLTLDQKESNFPKNWPLGFDVDDEDDRNGGGCQSFCLDASCLTESSMDLKLGSLLAFTRALEKLGLKIIDLLANAVGFENPVGEDTTKFSSLMWLSKGQGYDETVMPGGFYPYVVGLQYQIRCRKYSLLGDSGWISVSPQVDSVMVTIGDIAQVWSNGKMKKVRGRPVACLGDEGKSSRCISMSLVVTLPQDSRISPLLPKDEEGNVEEEDQAYRKNTQKKMFNSFPLEEYAWRVYHQRLPLKDPLDRYRI
ncbi:hypothetical protein SLEP1_g37354 [Rubroshorea leprosula]|uniref:Uncharacterized protein n=1 Tax=Rubroshorea leprosula TaxID=152421 RepID=A0AAV5KUM7_9ROSI|nr:hypothetical protein SLEP1_g37354 [Rubroshorea leprosula]